MAFDIIHAHTGRRTVVAQQLGFSDVASAEFGTPPADQIILVGRLATRDAEPLDWLADGTAECMPKYQWIPFANEKNADPRASKDASSASDSDVRSLVFVYDKRAVSSVAKGSYSSLIPILQPAERHLPNAPPSPSMSSSPLQRARDICRSRCRLLRDQVHSAVECSRERASSVLLAAQVGGLNPFKLTLACCSPPCTKFRRS
jgi:hypothetical protein